MNAILLLFFELTFYKVEAPDLLQKDRSTTSEKTMPDISNAVPTTTLRDLEKRGLVSRIQYNEIPPHVEYTATENAKDLKDIFAAMWAWGEKYAKE